MIGGRPAQIATQIEERLAAAGFGDVKVALDRKWVATISGEVTGVDQYQAAQALLRGERAVKSYIDILAVKPSPEEIRAAAMQALDSTGISDAAAAVDGNSVLTVNGFVENAAQRDAMLTALRAIGGVATVDDKTDRSQAWIARDVNEALTLGGLSRVRLEPRGESAYALIGEVETAADAVRAAAIARNEGAAAVASQVRIAPPQPVAYAAPAQPAAQAQTAAAFDYSRLPDAFVGQWGAMRLDSGPVRYAVMMTIRPGPVGGDVGQAVYGTTNPSGTTFTTACAARLTLKSVEAGVIVVEETLTQRSLICPGNKIVRLQTISGGLQGEWRRKKDNSLAMSGPLTPGSWNAR